MRKVSENDYIIKDNDLELFYKDTKYIYTFKDNDKSKFKKQVAINKVKKWLQFPIIGFNNSFYDINICKEFDFMKYFNPLSAIKQGTRYKTLSNKDIVILDQMQYCPAGVSLDKYLKSRKTDFI